MSHRPCYTAKGKGRPNDGLPEKLPYLQGLQPETSATVAQHTQQARADQQQRIGLRNRAGREVRNSDVVVG